MVKKIGRFIYYNLFFLTPLLVLSSTSELFELNKMNLIYLSSATVALLLAITMVRSKQLLLRRSIYDKVWLTFLGVIVLATVFSIDRHTSLFGYYGRFNGGLLSLLSYSVLFYGFCFFFEKKDILKILKVSVLSSVVVMIWGLSGKLGHDLSCLLFTGQFNNSCWTDQFRPAERMFSTLGQPNWLGAYLAIHFFIGLYFVLTKHFKRWYLSYSYLLLTFICLLSTKSRSSLLSVAVGCLIYGAIILWQKQGELITREKKKFIGLAVLFLLSVLIFKTGIDRIDNLTTFQKASSSTSDVEVNGARQLSSEVTESLDIRKIVWKGAVDLGFRYPLLGTGPETFAFSYYFTRPVEHNLTSEWDYIYNKAHNEYLNYLATTGFLGLLSYLALVAVVLWSLRSQIVDQRATVNEKVLHLSLLCAYVTILVTNFFGFSTTVINLFFFLIPAFVTARSTNRDYFNFENEKIMSQQKIQLALSVVVYLFCLVWLLTFFVADTQYAQGLLYEGSGDYIKADQKVTTASNLHGDPVYFDKRSNLDANLALISAYQGDKDLTSKFLTSSRLANLKALRSSSKNIQYWKTSAKNNLLYYQVTLDKKYLTDGLSSVQTAMSLAPTEPKLPYTEAVFYSVLADDSQDKTSKDFYSAEAVASTKRALELKSNYEAAKIFLDKLTTE